MSRFPAVTYFGVVLGLGFVLASGAASGAEPIATFSIVGYDPDTGELGVAVQSKFFAVGSVVPWAKAGVGAIATQAFGNTTFGPRGLELMEQGKSVEETMALLLAPDEQAELRQVGIVDANGRSVAHTGSGCMAWAGHETGPNFTAQGNILVDERTVAAMARAFRETDGMLGEKLMRALEEGQAAGGDSRGRQSAAILVVKEGGGYGGFNDRYCDLRVDDNPEPIVELRRIFDLWRVHALIYEGYDLAGESRFDEAVASGKKALALDPGAAESHYHLACYLSLAGRPDDAAAQLRTALTMDPSLRSQARSDRDLARLREDPTHAALFESGS